MSETIRQAAAMGWRGWLRSLVAAAINGGAAAGAAALAHGELPSLSEGATAFAVGALAGVFLYLQRSPLPEDL